MDQDPCDTTHGLSDKGDSLCPQKTDSQQVSQEITCVGERKMGSISQ